MTMRSGPIRENFFSRRTTKRFYSVLAWDGDEYDETYGRPRRILSRNRQQSSLSDDVKFGMQQMILRQSPY